MFEIFEMVSICLYVLYLRFVGFCKGFVCLCVFMFGFGVRRLCGGIWLYVDFYRLVMWGREFGGGCVKENVVFC